jgi:hypothetical protein
MILLKVVMPRPEVDDPAVFDARGKAFGEGRSNERTWVTDEQHFRI